MPGIKLNAAAKALFSGDVLNASTVGSVLAEVLAETIGPGSIAVDHFNRKQGKWPALATSTLTDKRKRAAGSKKFFLSGATYRAISLKPAAGKLRDFGSSADIYSTARASQKRLASGGLYVNIKVGQKAASLTVGFNGVLKHSAAFNKARREAAVSRGTDLTGLRGRDRTKAIRHGAAISHAEARLASVNADRRARGQKTFRKFAAKGSKGLAGKLDSLTSAGTALARGTENLAYANLLQVGAYKGIRTKQGNLVNPQHIANKRRAGKRTDGTHEHGKKFPLLPYETADEARIARAIERGLEKVFRELERAA